MNQRTRLAGRRVPLPDMLVGAIQQMAHFIKRLASARRYARIGAWYAILELSESNPCADDVRRARRRLQLSCHEDKGGSADLSQLINHAADILLERCPEVRAQRQEARIREEAEEYAQQEAERDRLAREREQQARERTQRAEDEWRERRRRAHQKAVAGTAARGARYRKGVYLSMNTGNAFPFLRLRLDYLQRHRACARARCLAYAAEAEVAMHRMA